MHVLWQVEHCMCSHALHATEKGCIHSIYLKWTILIIIQVQLLQRACSMEQVAISLCGSKLSISGQTAGSERNTSWRISALPMQLLQLTCLRQACPSAHCRTREPLPVTHAKHPCVQSPACKTSAYWMPLVAPSVNLEYMQVWTIVLCKICLSVWILTLRFCRWL